MKVLKFSRNAAYVKRFDPGFSGNSTLGINLKNLEARLIRRHIFGFRVQIFTTSLDLTQPDVGKVLVKISNEFNFEEIILAKDLAHLVTRIGNQKLFS